MYLLGYKPLGRLLRQWSSWSWWILMVLCDLFAWMIHTSNGQSKDPEDTSLEMHFTILSTSFSLLNLKRQPTKLSRLLKTCRRSLVYQTRLSIDIHGSVPASGSHSSHCQPGRAATYVNNFLWELQDHSVPNLIHNILKFVGPQQIWASMTIHVAVMWVCDCWCFHPLQRN